MKYWTYGVSAVVLVALMAGSVSAQDRRGAPDFETLDVTGDGFLNADDFEAGREARFAEMDANGDGSVSAEEFVAFTVTRAGERAESRATALFERLDSDGDGVVSRETLQARGGDRGDRLDRMIERFDANEDGSLSEEEFDTARAEMRDRGRGDGQRRHR